MTATLPRLEPDPPADHRRDPPPGPVTLVIVLAGGFLLGGPYGLAVAAVCVLVWRRRPDWLGAVVVGLLVLAAAASVVGAWPGPDSLRQSFADDRPWAAAAGLGAGVALLVSVARAARADRVDAPSARARGRRVDLVAAVGPWLPVGGLALAAGAVWLVAGPEPLTDDALAAAEALRVGAGLDGAAATGQPPLALVVAAVFPTTLALVPAVLSGATVLASFLLGRRLAGRRCGLVAAALVAALPLLWDQRLPGVLAGLATVVALLLVWPDRVTVARAGTAGGLLVLASLARAEAVLVVPVAAVWLAAWPGRTARRERRAALVAFVVVALTGVAVAVAGVPRADGDWVPGGAPDALGTGPLGPLAALIGLGLLALAIDELAHRAASGGVSWRRHLPWLALPALGGVVALLGRGDHGLGFVVAPLVAVGAAAALARRAGGSTAAGSGP